MKPNSSKHHSFIKTRYRALSVLLRHNFIPLAIKKKTIQELSFNIKSLTYKNMRKADPESQKELLLTSIPALGLIQEEFAESNELRSLLLQRLCSLLPRALKLKQRRASTASSHKSIVSVPFLITCLFNLGIECTDVLDEKIVMDTSSELQEAVITCLKNGIANTSADNISICCLRFIRVLLTALSKSESAFSKILNPSQIHMMIVTHSLFESTLTLKGFTTNAQDLSLSNTLFQKVVKEFDKFDLMSLERLNLKDVQLELAHLLLCCASLGKENIEVENSTWYSLFSAYNAGVSELDCVLRRIFYLYEQSLKKKGKVSRSQF